jgi:signal peptidase I
VIAAGHPLGQARAFRLVDRVALAILLAAVSLLLAVMVLHALGYRILIDRSDSMHPAISAGDVLVSKLTRPSRVVVGDVVTFRDPLRQDELVTHRVSRIAHDRDSVAFISRGDANTGEERWAVETGGRVGILHLRVPNLGFLLIWLTVPIARICLLGSGSAMLALIILRRIWTR